MALIDWTDEDYSLEIVDIDEQHKQLVNLLNNLHDSMKKGMGRVVVGDIINELVNYTEYHFCAEESMFCKAGFQHADEHKLSHCKFKGKLLEFKQQFEAGESKVALEIFRYLCEWIDNHIRKADKSYAAIVLDTSSGEPTIREDLLA